MAISCKCWRSRKDMYSQEVMLFSVIRIFPWNGSLITNRHVSWSQGGRRKEQYKNLSPKFQVPLCTQPTSILGIILRKKYSVIVSHGDVCRDRLVATAIQLGMNSKKTFHPISIEFLQMVSREDNRETMVSPPCLPLAQSQTACRNGVVHPTLRRTQSTHPLFRVDACI